MPADSVEAWLAQCRSEDPVRQLEAVQNLIDLKARASVPTLIELLASPHDLVRAGAAAALSHLGSEDIGQVGPALLDHSSDPDALVRAEIVDAFGILRYAPALKAIERALVNDPAPLVRAAAAETIGDLDDASAVPCLQQALNDPDDAVRGYAANSIGLLAATSALSMLQHTAASEPSLPVKAELHAACYRLGAAEQLQPLLVLLESGSDDLAFNIANIIQDLTNRKLPPTLVADSGKIRAAAIRLAQRVPVLSADVDQILLRLDVLAHNDSPSPASR